MRRDGPAGHRTRARTRRTPACPTSRQPEWDPFWETLRGARAADQLPHRRRAAGDGLGTARRRGRRMARRPGSASARPTLFLGNAAGDRQPDLVAACRALPEAASSCRSRAASAGSRSSSTPSTTRWARTRPTTPASCRCCRRSTSGGSSTRCFWFERTRPRRRRSRALGADRCMFETDFPHPTCLYPDGLDGVRAAIAELDADDKRDGSCRTTPPASTAYRFDAAPARSARDKPRGLLGVDRPEIWTGARPERRSGGRGLSGWSAPGSSTPSAAGVR